MSPSRTLFLVFLLFLIQIFSSISQALVPTSSTFKYVNQGAFSPGIGEYHANYRTLDNNASLFQLCWYNNTPNTYYLSLGVGPLSSNFIYMMWVWDFNRGNPVRENATFSLRIDGNLVLADADDHVVWQSGTSNKGVVSFKLLPTGNMVLQDAKGKFIWQSFNYATDTILVGQSLTKLVSRASPQQNVDGPHSLVLEPKSFVLYYKSKNSTKPQVYYDSSGWLRSGNKTLEQVKLSVTPDGNNAYEISLEFKVANSLDKGRVFLAKTKYNSVTYLRLRIDGMLDTRTYMPTEVSMGWDTTFSLFSYFDDPSRVTPTISSCQLPENCGILGLCEGFQCVACPSPNGMPRWTENCKPDKILSCAVKDVEYYKLIGVEHFSSKYTKGDGPMKESDCAKKCTLDCKCSSYFYHQDKSMCWIAYDSMTLTLVGDKKHLGYIKF